MKIERATKVTLEGRGIITLSSNDHVATGGEGSIYRKGPVVVKLFTDPAKMVRDGMVEKIRLLANIQHPYVVGPQGVVLNTRNEPVGYYMPWAEGEPLSRVFTNAFWQREGFTDAYAATLVARMRETVQGAHGHGATLVDANELNWIALLKGNGGPEPRVLDVDSWSIGRWPATVIMPSIRDPKAKTFDHKSDWFSWGVVTFQLFAGVHPYKGMIDGYKPSELERRMKDGVSVFAPGVRLNAAVRDFNRIPPVLLGWYQATFQQGERSMPPSPFDKAVTAPVAARVKRVVTTATGKLEYNKLFAGTGDPVIRVFTCGVVLRASGALVDLATQHQIGTAMSPKCEVVTVENGWLLGDLDAKGQPVFSCINRTSRTSEALKITVSGHKLVRYENRLFLVTDQGLSELTLMRIGATPILSISNTWGAMFNSTRWFDGVGVQDAMGAVFLITPFGENACTHVRVRELDGVKIVDAKAGNRFVSIVSLDKSGNYQRWDFAFGKDYQSYKITSTALQGPDLNLAILPKGVCASILEDGELIIFVPFNGATNTVADKAITADMALGNLGDKVVYIHEGNLWSLSLKP